MFFRLLCEAGFSFLLGLYAVSVVPACFLGFHAGQVFRFCFTLRRSRYLRLILRLFSYEEFFRCCFTLCRYRYFRMVFRLLCETGLSFSLHLVPLSLFSHGF